MSGIEKIAGMRRHRLGGDVANRRGSVHPIGGITLVMRAGNAEASERRAPRNVVVNTSGGKPETQRARRMPIEEGMFRPKRDASGLTADVVAGEWLVEPARPCAKGGASKLKEKLLILAGLRIALDLGGFRHSPRRCCPNGGGYKRRNARKYGGRKDHPVATVPKKMVSGAQWWQSRRRVRRRCDPRERAAPIHWPLRRRSIQGKHAPGDLTPCQRRRTNRCRVGRRCMRDAVDGRCFPLREGCWASGRRILRVCRHDARVASRDQGH